MTFYICNGENPFCNLSNGCFKNGGNCHHTSNLEYAATEECQDPQHHPERFEPEVVKGLPTYYFERIVQ